MNVRSYVQHAMILLFGSGAAQLVNLASYPVLARLYEPAEFGSFALFLSVVGVLGPISCARFDLIVQTCKAWQLPAVYRQALRLNAMVSGCVAIAATGVALLSSALDVQLALLIGAGVFLTGYTLNSNSLLMRQERFRLSAQSVLLRAAIAAVAQVALRFVLPGPLGLIWGFILGFAAQAAVLHFAQRGLRWRRSTGKQRRSVVARYRPQVSIDVPSAILAGLVLNVMSFLALDLYSRTVVGYYSLAFRVAVLPLSLISGSLSDVFFQKASAAYRATGEFWHQVRFNILTSAALSLIVFVPLAMVARPLFDIAFGSAWLPAADMLILLTPMLVVRFISSTVQTAPLVMGRPKLLLAQNIGLLMAILIGYLLAKFLDFTVENYLLLTSVFMAFVYGYYVTHVALVSRRMFDRRPFNPAIEGRSEPLAGRETRRS